MSWQQSTIDEACLLVTDGTHYTPPDVGQGVPFLTVKDLSNNGHIDLVGCSHITKDEFEKAERGNSAPKPGDVLFSKDGTVGKVYVVDSGKTFAVLSSLAILRPDASRLDASYFGWVLKTDSCLDQASQSKTGSAIRRVVLKDLKRVRFPLPPLAEQKRIAGILDAADALRAKRREALAELDTLTQSTFLDMFGDPVTNPMRWEMATIGQVTTCLDRLRKPVKETDRVDGEVPYYGANGQQGWINEALFDEPLILVAEDGGHFGDPARGVAYRIDGPSWVNNHAHVLRPATTVDVEYLHRALRHYNFGPYISGSTRAKLNQAQLNKARLALPPLDLQRRFAVIAESVERQKVRQVAHHTELDTLMTSLQSRAFRGDL